MPHPGRFEVIRVAAARPRPTTTQLRDPQVQEQLAAKIEPQ